MVIIACSYSAWRSPPFEYEGYNEGPATEQTRRAVIVSRL